MKVKIFYFVIFLHVVCWVNAICKIQTETLSDRIKTLCVSGLGDWAKPAIINLHTKEQIEITFDRLGAGAEHYTYRIIHLDVDWTPSQLIESEYLDGFQYNSIENYTFSFNTQMDYVHYQLIIPNEKVKLKVSGNYAVQIISEDGNAIILNACFSVVEPQVNIHTEITPFTNKGSNTKYQAVSIEVAHGNDIKIPPKDIKIRIQQNNRKDNEVSVSVPHHIQYRKVVYSHRSELIFESGNEYRSFEMITNRRAGMNIIAVEFHPPYYHSILCADYNRNNHSYIYRNDINGKMFVRSDNATNANTESDYHLVHFYLSCKEPFLENVYILSEAFNNCLDSRSQMEYNAQQEGYVKVALLKEGYYNYLYVTRKNASSPASTFEIEGDYYQTENEYKIMVYSRTIGTRYDRLIGVQTIHSK